tara:strand:- start:119 stop:685 length:567 start_codon:yes stop_codon:yes gene_type:complete
MLQNIFITSIWNVNLDLDLENLKKEINQITNKDKGRIISNQGGYQSNNIDVENNININFLSKAILNNTDAFKKHLNLNNRSTLQNMWINKNYFKDFNILHNHPNACISGVYYVQCPKESGTINFQNPSADGISYAWENKIINYNNNTSSTWTINPESNQLLLFPAYLKHYVKPNLSKEERISISFNLQ